MSTKLICVTAAPSVRTLCPPEFIEGRWMEVPEYLDEIEAYGAPRPSSDADQEAQVPSLIGRPNGKMVRRSFDGATAPIWELRHADDWPRRENLRLYGE